MKRIYQLNTEREGLIAPIRRKDSGRAITRVFSAKYMAKTSTISYSPAIERQPQIAKTKRAAIYIRCSSDEAKREGYSPETQEERLKEFVKINGWQLDKEHIYKDIGHSGGTDKRPDFQRFLKDARNKELDIVIVYRLDRFFRNLRLLLNTLEELKTLNIDFKSSTESFDTSTLSGEVTLTALGMAADLVRKITKGSRDEGSLKALKDGKWITGGPIPYGYKLNRKTHKLEIYKKESSVIKTIFELVAYEKLSKYKVQQKLNRMKVPTKYDSLGRTKTKKVNGLGFWHVRTVDRILKNEIYTGECYYRKYKYYINSLGKKEKELRPKEEWEIFKTPAIISKRLYETTQIQLRKNCRNSPRNIKMTYAFRNKIYCGLDGWKYYAFYEKPDKSTREGRKFYRCSGKNRYIHAILCLSQEISENRILPPVWEKLRNLLTNPEIVMEELGKYYDEKNKRKTLERKITKIDKEISVLQQKQEKTTNLYLEEYINEDSCKKKIDEYKEREEKYYQEKEMLSQFLVKESEEKDRITSIHNLYNKLENSIENATYETKCQIIDRTIERITVKEYDLDIECNLPNLSQNNPKTYNFYNDTRRIKRKSGSGY